MELHSWGWGLASLSSLHSLAWNCTLKATFRSAIFRIPVCPVREDQKTNDVLLVKEGPQLPVMVIIPLNFARCMLPMHRDLYVRSGPWGWGLAYLPSLHSLAWNCALGVGGLGGWPPPLGLGSGLAKVYINRFSRSESPTATPIRHFREPGQHF